MFGRSKLATKLRRAVKPEPLDDLLARQLVGGRGQRDARHVGKALGDHRQADIFRAEIVPPLRYAMRLVDGEQRDIGPAEQGEAARRQQPLGRDIEQVEIAGEQPPLDLGGFLERQRGIEHRRVDAGFEQGRDLVVHQRDQRRHDDAAAVAQQRRELIAQRLAAAGRHQHQAIAAVGDMADDLLLRAAEGREAEHRVQGGQRVGGGGGDTVAGCGSRHRGEVVRLMAVRQPALRQKLRIRSIQVGRKDRGKSMPDSTLPRRISGTFTESTASDRTSHK